MMTKSVTAEVESVGAKRARLFVQLIDMSVRGRRAMAEELKELPGGLEMLKSVATSVLRDHGFVNVTGLDAKLPDGTPYKITANGCIGTHNCDHANRVLWVVTLSGMVWVRRDSTEMPEEVVQALTLIPGNNYAGIEGMYSDIDPFQFAARTRNPKWQPCSPCEEVATS